MKNGEFLLKCTSDYLSVEDSKRILEEIIELSKKRIKDKIVYTSSIDEMIKLKNEYNFLSYLWVRAYKLEEFLNTELTN